MPDREQIQYATHVVWCALVELWRTLLTPEDPS